MVNYNTERGLVATLPCMCPLAPLFGNAATAPFIHAPSSVTTNAVNPTLPILVMSLDTCHWTHACHVERTKKKKARDASPTDGSISMGGADDPARSITLTACPKTKPKP